MVDNAEQQRRGKMGNKKRMLPSEIAHRFSSKADILKYLSENCKWKFGIHLLFSVQLYVPPKLMVNKDFIR